MSRWWLRTKQGIKERFSNWFLHSTSQIPKISSMWSGWQQGESSFKMVNYPLRHHHLHNRPRHHLIIVQPILLFVLVIDWKGDGWPWMVFCENGTKKPFSRHDKQLQEAEPLKIHLVGDNPASTHRHLSILDIVTISIINVTLISLPSTWSQSSPSSSSSSSRSSVWMRCKW